MSMEHKAYLFDVIKYHTEIEKILDECCFEQNTSKAEKYINEHWKELCSPYTYERLDEKWKSILVNHSLQEYCDILLTACYECEEDIGLGYSWDGVNESLKQLNFMDNIEECVLGKRMIFHDTIIDPGAMGLGIVDIEEVNRIAEMLQQNRGKMEQMELPQNLLYPMEREEIEDAYDELIDIYNSAVKKGKGIMFTF